MGAVWNLVRKKNYNNITPAEQSGDEGHVFFRIFFCVLQKLMDFLGYRVENHRKLKVGGF